jgi:alpha-beta hydrolase superfamily lysophospholipase
MIEQIDTFVARDGLALRQRSWTPDLDARAVVALLHGGAEHSGRYEHTAKRLTSSGFQVDAFDQRSHGASERVHGVALQIDRFEDMLDDTEDWLASRHAVHDRRPLFVLAHSMGALIAVTLAARGRLRVDGLITTGAALSVRIDPAALAKAAEVAARDPDVILSPMPRGGFDGSTRDPDMRAVAYDDPLHADVQGVPAQFLAEIAKATAAVQLDLGAVAVPLLVLHGSADTMADPAMSAELVSRAASADKTLHVVPDGYHALLRDVDRAQVETLVIEWVNARLPGR